MNELYGIMRNNYRQKEIILIGHINKLKPFLDNVFSEDGEAIILYSIPPMKVRTDFVCLYQIKLCKPTNGYFNVIHISEEDCLRLITLCELGINFVEAIYEYKIKDKQIKWIDYEYFNTDITEYKYVGELS